MSFFESLKPVAELGEVTYSSLSDGGKESYVISSYQRAIKFSRQMLINDDLGELTGVSMKMGNAARRTEADLVYSIFTGNLMALLCLTLHGGILLRPLLWL
ncbi:MAG: hypothetical protein ABL903_19230 [Methylococcales bacterium]